MLWIVKTRADALVAGQRPVRLARKTGTRPVCQSLAWMTSGREAEVRDQFEHRPAEEDEPLGVVRVVGLVAAGHRLLVEAAALGRVVALEEGLVLDEVDRHVGVGQARADRRGRRGCGRRAARAGRSASARSATPRPADRRVERHDDGDGVPGRASARGRAAATSASPPVLANPATSLAATSTRTPATELPPPMPSRPQVIRKPLLEPMQSHRIDPSDRSGDFGRVGSVEVTQPDD